VLAAAAAADVVVVGTDADIDFDIAVGEDDIEVEEFAGLGAGWQGVLAAAAVGAAGGGGELEQVDLKTPRWEPVAGAGGDGDGVGHVQDVGYVVDVVELGEEAVAGIAKEVAESEIASKSFEVVVHEQVVVVVAQMRCRN